MLDGIPLIDAHVHAARLPTVRPAWRVWAERFGTTVPLRDLYDDAGTLVPERFHSYLQDEGVDIAILLCEYSPKTTGIQPVEDLLPLLDHDRRRVRFLANLNPHVHYPVVSELRRQLELGAVGLKIHPVHGGFPPNSRELYPAYGFCEERALPVVFHCGTSTFPGSSNRYADPALVDDVGRDFPDLKIVLAHGGRGWWYNAAAFLASARPNVWIEISGLPPQKLPDYYQDFDLARLAKKFIFGTDWPGVPGIRANALAVKALELQRQELELVFYKNALQVYQLGSLSVLDE